MAIAFAFFSKIFQSLAVSYIRDGFKNFWSLRRNLTVVGRYKKSLEQTLTQMPFIYKDVDLEVLEDYVDIEVQFVDTSNLKPLHILKNPRPLERLNQNFKALFIGSAGMGKSTFFRYSALSILKRKNVYFLSSLKKQIPIFISLKVVPNFGKSPIINSILKDIPFLRTDGINKLKKLTSNGKVFFLLDGYDEISFMTSKNHIRYELGLLLSVTPEGDFDKDVIDDIYAEIYKNIAHCTVWLSTREEFYRLNPIGIKAMSKEINTVSKSRDFIAVQLRGLGDNRLVLVKKIFDKYRIRSKQFVDILDEESFIEEIDTHEDEEMVKLSKRPLFLTILCYIHVNHLINNPDVVRERLPYLNELVLECIKVLLSDLDKYKVRGYTGEQKRLAFVNRRSGYEEEKTSFLKYFAFEMLLTGENVFDFETLEGYVKRYFKEISSGEKRSHILSEIETPKSNNPNFVVQLIFSGVFVVANSNSDHPLYDFPLRRFKEVLATEALRDGYMFNYFLSKITSRNLSEFVLLVFKQIKNQRDAIMKKLFENSREPEDALYISQLILNLIHQNTEFKIDSYMLTNLKFSVDANNYTPIYFEMLQNVRDSYSTIENLILKNINEHMKSNRLHSVTTSLELAEIVAPQYFIDLITNPPSHTRNKEMKVIFTKFQIKHYLASFGITTDFYEKYQDDISLTAISAITDKRFNDAFYIEYFKFLPLHKILLFWYLLDINNKQFSGKRKSSAFDSYKLIFVELQYSKTLEGFSNSVLKSLEGDLNNLQNILSSNNKKTEIEKIRKIENDVLDLTFLMEKVRLFNKKDWLKIKKQLGDYARLNFEYLHDRIDRHEFYYTQEDV